MKKQQSREECQRSQTREGRQSSKGSGMQYPRLRPAEEGARETLLPDLPTPLSPSTTTLISDTPRSSAATLPPVSSVAE